MTNLKQVNGQNLEMMNNLVENKYNEYLERMELVELPTVDPENGFRSMEEMSIKDVSISNGSDKSKIVFIGLSEDNVLDGCIGAAKAGLYNIKDETKEALASFQLNDVEVDFDFFGKLSMNFDNKTEMMTLKDNVIRVKETGSTEAQIIEFNSISAAVNYFRNLGGRVVRTKTDLENNPELLQKYSEYTSSLVQEIEDKIEDLLNNDFFERFEGVKITGDALPVDALLDEVAMTTLISTWITFNMKLYTKTIKSETSARMLKYSGEFNFDQYGIFNVQFKNPELLGYKDNHTATILLKDNVIESKELELLSDRVVKMKMEFPSNELAKEFFEELGGTVVLK